jgi:hypothetical protein
MEPWVDDFGSKLQVHNDGTCLGPNCTIHKTSMHALCLAPQKWDWERGIMLRVCVHGIEHTDVDEIKTESCFDLKCDGCCCEDPDDE